MDLLVPTNSGKKYQVGNNSEWPYKMGVICCIFSTFRFCNFRVMVETYFEYPPAKTRAYFPKQSFRAGFRV